MTPFAEGTAEHAEWQRQETLVRSRLAAVLATRTAYRPGNEGCPQHKIPDVDGDCPICVDAELYAEYERQPEETGWSEPPVLVKELADADPDERLARIHALIGWLATQDDLLRQRYRNAIVGAKLMGAQDWTSTLSSAKRRQYLKVRAEFRSLDCPYVQRDGCLYLTEDGGDVLLARFVPMIVSEVTRDDGAEVTTLIRIRVTLPNGRVGDVDVPADQLAKARRWSAQAVGASAVISPMSRDEAHVATAAQYLGAGEWTSEVVFEHTGWRVLDGRNRFLSASGALGADGLDAGVTVDLGTDRLNGYALADLAGVDDAELARAVRASLDLRHLAPMKLMVPLLAAAYRAPLPLLPETSVFVVGRSGSLKTAVSAVVAQHFGRRLDARNLPAEWKSTANSLEAMAHQLSNVLMVIDDYAPQASEDPRRLAAAADRIFRGSANSSGRGRMRADGTLRPMKPPRSQFLSTGEDVPPGESLRARLVIVNAEAVDKAKLTEAQQAAMSGTYELAMSGYVRWLADRQDTDPGYVDDLRTQITDLRSQLLGNGHLRAPEAAAGLLVGWHQFLKYAVSIGALTAEEAKTLVTDVFAAIRDTASDQSGYAVGMKVADVYLTALRAALTGGNAYLADQLTGAEPRESPRAWGWESYTSGEIEQWRPRGKTCIGWLSATGDVLLDPDAAYEVARDHANKAGAPFATTKVTTHKRLHEDRHLGSVTTGPNEVTVSLTVGRRIFGKLRKVLHVKAERLDGSDE